MGRLLPCNVVHMDDYYLPPDRRAENWEQIPAGNMDLARFLQEVLVPAGPERRSAAARMTAGAAR